MADSPQREEGHLPADGALALMSPSVRSRLVRWRSMDEDRMTPTQRSVMSALRSGERPTHSPQLAIGIQTAMENELSEFLLETPLNAPLTIRKFDLAVVHQCEGRHVANKDAPFTYSTAMAKGALSHKAVELWLGSATARPPQTHVERAFERLTATDDPWTESFAHHVNSSSEAENAELVAAAVDNVVRFFDMIGTVPRHWIPRVEAPTRKSFCRGSVTFAGKMDMVIGRAQGMTSGALIIDLKTGRAVPQHLDDLRFYALLEMLRTGVAPFRVASMYLDSGDAHVEDVTEASLWSAARRAIDGARKIIRLVDSETPTLTAGPLCAYCPAKASCPVSTVDIHITDEEEMSSIP